KLIGLAVDVDIATREVGPHQRMAAPDHAENELVDKGILRAAQRRHIEPRGGQKLARIDAAAMGRIEHDRPAPVGGLQDLERRGEFVFAFLHEAWPSFGAARVRGRSTGYDLAGSGPCRIRALWPPTPHFPHWPGPP